jgi:predicted enzyme related to lactoylglutathione lyase
MTKQATVTSVKFICVYVDKLEPAQAFYEKYLGFKKMTEFGQGQIFGTLGNIEMWMGEGYQRMDSTEKSSRATVMLGVDSVDTLFQSLKTDNIKLFQDSPVEMHEGIFWLQFQDPAGNIIEVLGAK